MTDASALPGLIQCMSYGPDSLEESRPARVEDARRVVGERTVTWINVDASRNPDVLAALETAFGIHPLVVEDIQNTRQRPKVEEYPGYVYIVTRIPWRDEHGSLETEQVSVVFSENWLITVQERPGDVFDAIRQRIRQGRPRIRGSGPDYLAYAILDAVVDAYFPLIERIGDDAETLEDDIIDHATDESLHRLQDLRRSLLALRRVAWPQRDALNALERGDIPLVTAETRTFLRDVSDHAARVIDFVETNRETASNLMELYLSGVSQRTSDVMKTLTIVATIFIPLTFVAGVYGMNFERMPELTHPLGYPAVLTLMFVAAVLMLVMFRRRGWL